MTLLNLTDVTLVCVDTVNPDLALRAMRRCQASAQFARSLLFTNRPIQASGIEIIQVDGVDDIAAYSRFVLKGLAPHINSSHALLVQWDGFIIHPSMWRDTFLSYDYIGATWPASSQTPEMVGNGGFSLRSKKLLQALQDIQFDEYHPEDEQLARVHRPELEAMGICFAPVDVADQFAYEFKAPKQQTFGFHGFSHFPDFMANGELAAFVEVMPAGLLFNNYFLEFARKLKTRSMQHAGSAAVWQGFLEKIQQAIQAANSERLAGGQTKHLISGFCRMRLGSMARSLAMARLKTRLTAENLRLLAKTFFIR